MIRSRSFRSQALVAVAFVITLIPLQMSAATVFVQRNLVSDIPGFADFTDPNVVNPWGVVAPAIWICNNRTGTYNVYGADGTPSAVVTTVPPAPGRTGKGSCTGTARNANAAAFRVDEATAGTFVLVTEDGLITIRSGPQNIIKVGNSGKGAVYKGVALSNNPDFIYAANFNSGKIEVYDGTWQPATLPGNFTDPQVPEGFAPFNVWNLGGKLYVTYAKQDAAKRDDVAGPGNGFVAVFDLNGNLLQHLVSGGALNSPWGVAIAPDSWGDFAGALLVGNFRDGVMNAYNLSNGSLLGQVRDASGNPIVNIGLWALYFGIGGNSGDPNKLFFTAGISAGDGIESHGLVGVISVGVTPGAPPSVNDNGVVNGASFAAGGNQVAPGAIVSVFGSNLTDGTSCVHSAGCDPTFDNTKHLRTSMSGAQIIINNDLFHPVPIFAATPTQLNFQVPVELTGTSFTIQVKVNGQASALKTIQVAPITPGIFAFNSQGTGAGAITHNDNAGTPISDSSPAAPGETIVIYATGLGSVTPSVATGTTATGLTATVAAPTVTIDGVPAQVSFSGLAPCCVGLNQINVVLPSNVRTSANVNVSVSIGGKQSNTVTIATRTATAPTAPPPVPAAALSSLNFSQTTLNAGASYQGRVALSAAADSDTVVTLSSSNPAMVSVPASITVAAGSDSATFTLSSSVSVSAATSVTITATSGGVTQSATLTVEPPPPPPTPNPNDY